MIYKAMIENARSAGITSEKAMLASVDRIDQLLEDLKESNPDKYWKFIRKSHEDLYGPHYDEEFAEYDVKNMRSDLDGHSYTGAHWSKDDIVLATNSKSFPGNTSSWDLYVAFNAMWHDLHKQFADEDILEAAYLFFFKDDDAPDGKIWKYMCAMLKG